MNPPLHSDAGSGANGSRIVDDWLGDGAAGEVAADDEFAVVGFFHAAVFPDDHAGDGVAALNVGDVEAFDAARLFQEIERVLNGFADHFRSGLEDAEALFEGVLGVVRNEVEEGALGAALRREDFDFVPGAIGEGFFEQLAIFELDGDVDGFREIGGVKVKLLEERGDEFVGVEFVEIFPEKFAAIDDAAAAQVEEIGGDERSFGVEGEDVGVVALSLRRCAGALRCLRAFGGDRDRRRLVRRVLFRRRRPCALRAI